MSRIDLERLTPGGTQTYSKHPRRFPPGTPDQLLGGQGCAVVDRTGQHVLIDCVSALGAIILGYQDPDVDDAIREQLGRGISFSLATDVEEDVADLVCRTVPGADMVRFMKNGADACAVSVRLARAATERERVVSIGYHGYQDWTMAHTNPRGVPAFNAQLLRTVPYNDVSSLTAAVQSDTACVILEPMVATHPEWPRAGFLEEVRMLCDVTGAILIFDEVVTGFRMALGGAQEHFGITADLVASGKAMANGMPLSIVTGKRELMELLDGRVFASTTFGGETLSLVAARATINKLRAREVPRLLAEFGTQLIEAYELAASQADMAEHTTILGYPARPVITWDTPARAAAFGAAMLQHGFLFQGYLNLTLAHVEYPGLLDRFKEAFIAGTLAARTCS